MKTCHPCNTYSIVSSILMSALCAWIWASCWVIAVSLSVKDGSRSACLNHCISQYNPVYNGFLSQEAFIKSVRRHTAKNTSINNDGKLYAHGEYEDQLQENEYDGIRHSRHGRIYASRADRRRAGKLLRRHQLSRQEDHPLLTEDFGGVPNLPHKTPISLPDDNVNDEFMAMRKRNIPHSLLKDYYMLRSYTQEEIEGFDDSVVPILDRSHRDERIYLFGEGIFPDREIYIDEDQEAGRDKYNAAAEDRVDGSPKEQPSANDLSKVRRQELHEEMVRKTREMAKKYNEKDKVCQLLLSSIKEFQEVYLNPPIPEEPPEDSDVLIKELDDYFIINTEEGSPIWLHSWDKEYAKGRQGLKGKELEKYDLIWHNKLDRFMDRYYYLFKTRDILDEAREELEARYGHVLFKKQPKQYMKQGAYSMQPEENAARPMWSEHIPIFLLETLAKYAFAKEDRKLNKEQLWDQKAESFKACIALSMNRSLRERALKENEEERLEYIDFLRKRRRILKNEHFRPQPNTPYWLWKECWQDRDAMIPNTILEILKSIHAVDPSIDLRKVIKGTIENIKSPKIRGTKFDITNILDDSLSSRLGPIEEFLKEAETTRATDGNALSPSVNAGENGVSHTKETNVDTVQVSSEEKTSDFPKPLGYYFKDVLSFDEFEKQLNKFNVDCFGTEEYGVRVGQLVKGTVEIVRPKHMLIDIHTSKFASLKLSDHYEEAKDVPSGGFTVHFKPGDELYFEVIYKYGNNIRLSTRRINTMHKSRDIYRKYFKREVMKVRVLQRYTHGILVQYQGDDVEDIKNYRCPRNLKTLENLAFVPYNELDVQYRSLVHHIKRDIVGKVIPVYISDFVECNGILLVSNIEALRRLLLAHIKPGDLIMAYPCMYGKDSVWLHLGHTIGILPITEMKDDEYEKHKQGDVRRRMAIVTSVDLEAGTMHLSTKLIEQSHTKKSFNECFKMLKQDPDVIRTYNDLIKGSGRTSSLNDRWKRLYPEPESLYDIQKIPTMKLSIGAIPKLPITRKEKEERTFDGVHWDLNSPDFPDNYDNEERHGYHNYRWEVMTEDGWVELSPAEMHVLNRAKYQHDEVVYYQHERRDYRTDLVEMVRQNLTDFVEQPLRNNCYRPDYDDYNDIRSLQDINMELNNF